MTQNGNSKNPLHGLWALTNRELKKWYKNPYLLILSIIQPLIWMGLFGRSMNIGAIFTNYQITIPQIPGVQPSDVAKVVAALSSQFNVTKIMENTFQTS